MNLLVTPNNDKQGIYESTTKLCGALHDHGARIYMLNSDREKYGNCCDISGGNVNELTKKCDAVIALGGDGTILRSATIAAVYDKPILGLNQGRLGFMAGLEMSELELISRLFTKQYEIQRRMLIDVAVRHNGKCKYRNISLNDVFIISCRPPDYPSRAWIINNAKAQFFSQQQTFFAKKNVFLQHEMQHLSPKMQRRARCKSWFLQR